MSLNTDNQRASKRQRTSRSTTSTHFDPIPFHEDEEYHQIYHREGRSRIAGEHATTSRTVTTVASNNELWVAKVSWTPQDDPNYALDEDGAGYDDAVEAEVMEDEEVVKKKYPRSRVSKRPHVVWKDLHRSSYLDEITRWDGRGDFVHSASCPDCISRKTTPPGLPEYRCRECFHPDLVCAACCVKRHRMHPLHWVEQWSNNIHVTAESEYDSHDMLCVRDRLYVQNALPPATQ